MYCRSRPQYRSDLGWILGVAFLGTLTRSARPAQGFTYVRCCSAPPASSPHDLAAPGRIVSRRPHLRAVAFGLRLLPTCSAEDLHLQSRVHAWHTVLAALASPPATKALNPDPFPCRSLRHVVYAALLHFGLETARSNLCRQNANCRSERMQRRRPNKAGSLPSPSP